MKITFNSWSADEIISSYLDFIRDRNSKTTYIIYTGIKDGFTNNMEGRLEIDDPLLKEMPKKIQFAGKRHSLELMQKDWKIQFHLSLRWDNEDGCEGDSVELSFDDSLRKEVYNHFKEFGPEKIEN